MTMRATFALACCLLIASCSAAPPDPGPVFDNEGNQAVGCMKHQPAAPGARYLDPGQVRTDETLPLLRYYTANGRKAYCDHAAPSAADRAWAGVYVSLGAERVNVAGLLG
ncbi:hypothetical protein M8542_48560 [Amycolatopsis sp. OK19-0408]|uniref:Lipoprotein n=1 Tax=Amycolatopsis iheyensis TaxID=2945988 RepID=A0A9X2NMH9_9PSEU|nr:hypothetical protein [Amycolatopsis iheyensis]MCR6490677.1 hypothetical protein [Amycolatopsis iheyensis]